MARKPRDLPLDRLEAWMQAVLLHPGTIEDALESPAASWIARAEDVVLPSSTLPAAARVAIYRDMVAARFANTLRAQFPGVVSALGECAFARLAADYVATGPSRSFTLARLGDRMPEFLECWSGLPRGERLALADLARLELALEAAFDLPLVPPVDADRIGGVPETLWEHARLRPLPSLRILRVDHDVLAAQAELDADRRVTPPRRRRVRIAIWRDRTGVRTLALRRRGLVLLERLAEGRTLGEALSVFPVVSPRAVERWLAEWVGAGLFGRVVLPAA